MELSVDENVFWILVWALVFAFLATVVLGSLNYYKHKNEVIASMSEKSSPMEAYCALSDYEGDSPTCLVSITGSLKK